MSEPLRRPVTDPAQIAEMRLAQAQESVIAAALAYDQVENHPGCGSTARAAYWSAYLAALGSYADVHASVFPAPSLAPEKDARHDASTARLKVLIVSALQATANKAASPTTINSCYERVALENMYHYIGRIKNVLPRGGVSAPIGLDVSRETFNRCSELVPLCVESGVHSTTCRCALKAGHKGTHVSADNVAHRVTKTIDAMKGSK